MRTSHPLEPPGAGPLPVSLLLVVVLVALASPLLAADPRPAAGGPKPAVPPAAPAPGTGAPPPPHLTVYFTEEKPGAGETPDSRQGTMAQAISEKMQARRTAATPGVMTGVATAVFLAVGLVAMRHRSRVCPRCSARLVELGDPADAAAEAPGDPGEDRGELWACPACGELGRLRLAGFLFRKDDRCPRCGRDVLRSGYTAVEPATYLMYGLVRIDEECAACDYKAAFSRSMPPNEAPPPDWPGSSIRP